MELGNLGPMALTSITVVCYLVGMVIKATPWDNGKFIPIACGTAGGLLGVAALLCGLPDFPAGDPITAAAVGIASGLAATGVNQIYKQMKRKDEGEH